METQLSIPSRKELQSFEELLRKDEVLKDEKISQMQLILLYKLIQFEKHYEEFTEHELTPLIHS